MGEGDTSPDRPVPDASTPEAPESDATVLDAPATPDPDPPETPDAPDPAASSASPEYSDQGFFDRREREDDAAAPDPESGDTPEFTSEDTPEIPEDADSTAIEDLPDDNGGDATDIDSDDDFRASLRAEFEADLGDEFDTGFDAGFGADGAGRDTEDPTAVDIGVADLDADGRAPDERPYGLGGDEGDDLLGTDAGVSASADADDTEAEPAGTDPSSEDPSSRDLSSGDPASTDPPDADLPDPPTADPQESGALDEDATFDWLDTELADDLTGGDDLPDGPDDAAPGAAGDPDDDAADDLDRAPAGDLGEDLPFSLTGDAADDAADDVDVTTPREDLAGFDPLGLVSDPVDATAEEPEGFRDRTPSGDPSDDASGDRADDRADEREPTPATLAALGIGPGDLDPDEFDTAELPPEPAEGERRPRPARPSGLSAAAVAALPAAAFAASRRRLSPALSRMRGALTRRSSRHAAEAPAMKPAEESGTGPKARRAAPSAGGGRGSGGGRGRGGRFLRRMAKRLAIAGVVGFLFSAAALGVIYAMTPVPDAAQADATAQGSTLYYRDGKTKLARLGVNRQPVKLDEVPEVVRNAVLSAEHRQFYTEPGVSARGTIRALWSTVTGGQVQGGSTITQQLVRNYYEGFSRERTITRKLKEIMVSIKVDREQSKDWILEQYLNTIYLGRDAYGIQAAARAYYDKDVTSLNAAEAAYLAATIQQPTFFAEPYGPARAAAEARWRYVVDGMVEMGAIDAAEAARMKFPLPPKPRPTQTYKGPHGYLINQAKLELRRHGYSEDTINRSGLKIVTTYDHKLTKAAIEAVRTALPDKTSKKIQTGMVAVDPDNGEVVAFYGGRDYLEDQYDNAFSSTAQAGSGFKPYVLAAALDEGMPLTTRVDGHSPQIYAGRPVRNNADQNYGFIDLVTATQNSVNTAYVNLGLEVGLDKVVKTAERAGIPRAQLTANDVDKAPTISLGAASVSPVQQAAGYAAFANNGIYHRPHVIKSVTSRDGDADKRTFEEPGRRAFDADTARDATYAMRRVVEAGTGTGARLPDGRPVAGKTGTTDGGKAIWFNGYVPQLSVSVAMFRDDNKPLKIPGYSAYGGQLPALLWRTFMIDAMRGEPIKQFAPPTRQVPTSRPTPEESRQPTKRPRPSPTGEKPPTEEPTPPPRPTPSITIFPPEPPPPTRPEDRLRGT